MVNRATESLPFPAGRLCDSFFHALSKCEDITPFTI